VGERVVGLKEVSRGGVREEKGKKGCKVVSKREKLKRRLKGGVKR